MEHAYASVGRAVIWAQIFETALVPIFEIFKLYTEPGYPEKTGSYLPAGAFKFPIKNIIKALTDRGSIDPQLEMRLNSYVEDRHQLIHRWVQQNGWPADNDAIGFKPIIELANRVEREAKELTRLFAGYIIKFADPQQSGSDQEAYKSQMAAIFQRAHLEG